MRRRDWLKAAAGLPAAALAQTASPARGPAPGERPRQDPAIRVLNPRTRTPVSFIIDDSTCLVNLNRFAIPQFAAAWNNQRYHQDWRRMPCEIPDDFVRKFGHWCGEHGVKGKYSIVPYPACVGRLDRLLPGWTREELEGSLKLVRTLLAPNWDFHPEMVTHTRVIDLKTGQPYPGWDLEFMENWRWTDGKSVEELAAYMSYALRILHNVGLVCEGITTPGGFGSRVLPELAQATLQACREVFGAGIPHYFKHAISEGEASVAPRVEYATGIDGPDARCVVSILACTGDWTGGWDCSGPGDPDRFITPDLAAGRLVEVIGRGEPAILLAHWTGIYRNGEETGFRIFQEVVRRLHTRYDDLVWMKLSEIARYWAARELTGISTEGRRIRFAAPFACPDFTVRTPSGGRAAVTLAAGARRRRLREVSDPRRLEAGCWVRDGGGRILCFHLPKGASELQA